MDTKFQSRTFRFGFPEGEQFNSFKKDVDVLKEVNQSKLNEIIKYIQKIILADTEKEEHKFYNEIVELGLVDDPSVISSFNGFVKYFLKKFTDDKTKDDEPKIIVEDIAKKLKINKEELLTIEKLLFLIKENSDEYKKEELKDTYKKGLFPYLKSAGTTVELRGIFSHEIDFGEDIEKYSKEVKINKDMPAIATISVAITLDSGTPNRFCFQASPEHIGLFIKKLQGALYKAKILEEKFNIREILKK